MAVLSNINDKFAVDSTGAIKFNGQVGTSGYILKSNGNTAPTWVDPDTVIGGPYLPLTGGTLTGNLAINGTNSLSVGGAGTFGGNLTINGSQTIFNPDGDSQAKIINAGTNAIALFAAAGDTLYLGGNNTTGMYLDTSANATFAGSIYVPQYLIHDGDGNTYLEFSGGDNIKLVNGGTTALHAHDNGNLYLYGGGTTAQTISGANTTFAGDVSSSGTSKSLKYWRRLWTDANNDWGLNNNAGTGVISVSGMGTPSTSTITFAGTISAVGASTFNLGEGIFIKAVNTSNAISASNFWGYGLYEGASRIGEFSMVRDGSSSVYIGTSFAGQKLILGTAAKVPALTIDASQNATFAGNVGIGTGTPTTFLQVSGQGNRAGGNIQMGLSSQGASKWSYLTGTHYNSTSEPEGFALIGGYSDIDENRVVIGGDIWETNPATSIHFWTHSSSTHAQGGTEKMRILGNGNVGIGVTNPNEKLQLAGNLNAYAPSGINAGLFASTAAGSTTIALRSSGVTHFNGGNVGIGTTSPGNKLTIASGTGGGSAPDSRTLLHIDKNGEAYISINSPAESFNGIRLNVAGSPKAFMELYDNTAQGKKLNIGTIDARDLVFDTGNQPKMTILSGGNVGIGTQSPGEKLDVQGNILVGDYFKLGSSANYMGQLGLNRNIDTGGIYNSSYGAYQIQNYQGDLQFQIYNSSGGSVCTHEFFNNGNVFFNGNVGIGLTGPTAKLHVFEPTANTGVTLKVQSYSWDATLSLINDQGTWEILNDRTGLGTNGTLAFYNGGYRMALTPAGNVGIGTTAPAARLHVVSSTPDAAIFDTTSAVYGAMNTFKAQGVTKGASGYNAGSMYFGGEAGTNTIIQSGGQTGIYINNSTRNVGIGNTSPQTTLHVGTTTTVTNQFTNQVNASNFFVNGNANGGASFFQCKTAAVNINMMGNNDFACNQFTFYHKPLSTSQNVVGTIATFSSSTQYNTTSDYRLKENVIPLSDSIIRLKQLKPSRFNFIEDPERTMDGFLAHEVQNTVPEAVNGKKDAVDENGNEVHQGIDQAKLVPLLVAAVQELEARVKELENK